MAEGDEWSTIASTDSDEDSWHETYLPEDQIVNVSSEEEELCVPGRIEPRNTSEKQYGNMKVSLIKAEIADVKVDVLVNSTSQKLNLDQGIASKALLNKAGQSIQQECTNNYPNGISYGGIAKTGGGNLHAGNVYHVSLTKWDSSGNNKLFLTKLMTDCLQEASNDGLTSIAFPALGTGSLGYPKDVVAKVMVSSVENFQKNNSSSSVTDVRFVIFPKDLGSYKAFGSHFGAVCAPPLSKETVTSVFVGQIQVDLNIGNLAEQKCDIVMLTNTKSLDLQNGALSRAIADAAGPNLQTECSAKYPNGIDHGQVAIVGPSKLQCKAIYLGALPRHDKPGASGDPVKVLSKLVMACLNQASLDKMTSICFPTLGTGNLKYPSHVAAKCMLTAIKDYSSSTSNSSVKKVVIVIHQDSQDKNLQQFKQECAAYPDTLQLRPVPVLRRNQTPQRMVRKEADFKVMTSSNDDDIIAKDEDDDDSFRKDSPKPKRLSEERQSLRTKLDFLFKQPRKGDNSHRISPIPLPWKPVPPPIKSRKPSIPRRNTPEYCLHMLKQDLYPPSYWTIYSPKKSVKSWVSENADSPPFHLVDLDPATYQTIEMLIHKTWHKDKLFHGRDANGLKELKYNRLNVVKIQRIENIQLFQKYTQMKQELFQAAGRGGMFKQLRELSGKGHRPQTTEHLAEELKSSLHDELNEGFYFHGTKTQNVQGLQKSGLDPSLANEGAVFGKAIYMAESSTKADQYADERKGPRRKNDLKMFIVRSCLGNICMMKKDRKMKRPPCTETECLSDTCNHDNRHHSIVEEDRYIFREFVVYEGALVYPEYIITYERI